MNKQSKNSYTSNELFHLVGHKKPDDDELNYQVLCKVLRSGCVSRPPHGSSVHGTWASGQTWWRNGYPFFEYLEHDVSVNDLFLGSDPFEWSGRWRHSTIFSVQTSRRLFRGMVGLVETQSWQRALKIVGRKSCWPNASTTWRISWIGMAGLRCCLRGRWSRTRQKSSRPSSRRWKG